MRANSDGAMILPRRAKSSRWAGTPTDVALSELAVEMLFPANEATVAIVKSMVAEENAGLESAARRQRAG
jgi:hypothetical protein